MSSKFYYSIIECEKKLFHVKDDQLKIATRAVSSAYSTSSLKTGNTFLDYNVPANRCAYLYKYAATHTDIVYKYFKDIMQHNGVRFILEHKKDIKICCLGGGPGTDIVGMFKALATLPICYKKIVQVTILDLCGGWRNSFKHIMSRLRHGMVNGVPGSFVNSSNFKAELIAVDLMEPLTDNVKKIIANADIISMVKFVSAVINKKGSTDSLKVIGANMKFGAVVLFVDNFHTDTFKTFIECSNGTGFTSIIGPLCANYQRPKSHYDKNLFGCLPVFFTNVSVISWMKTSITLPSTSVIANTFDNNLTIENDEEGWDTDDESEESYDINVKACGIIQGKKSELEVKTYGEKFTQTYTKYFLQNVTNTRSSVDLIELSELVSALSDLIKLLQLRKEKQSKQCCVQHCCKSCGCFQNSTCS